MKLITIVFIMLLAMCVSLPAIELRLEVDEVDTATHTMCSGEKVMVDIYLDGWDTSEFPLEYLFGVQMFLYHDNTSLKVNLENSYPFDTEHDGPFRAGTSIAQVMEGRVKLIASNYLCVSIVSDKLLWTVEMEAVKDGSTDIYIQTNYPTFGFVSPGGLDCSTPYQVGADPDTVSFLIGSCGGNFDGDQDVDGTDTTAFLADLGRFSLNNPCTTSDPCNGDFDCDGDVDGTDTTTFLEDLGRFSLNKPCPSCHEGAWCTY